MILELRFTILELQAVRLTLKALPNNSHVCNTWDMAILNRAAFRLRLTISDLRF